VLIVSLVEKHVLAITTQRGKVLKNTIRANAVLQAQLLPELHAYLVAALAPAPAAWIFLRLRV
jgi:hypothetical protein